MKRIATGVLCCLAFFVTGVHAQPAAPSGWKVIKDNGKGRCSMAVPADWKEQEILGARLGAAKSPDKTADAVVNLMDGTAWKDFRSIVFTTYQKEKDRPKIKDGADLLWFEIVSMGSPSQTRWYVARPAGSQGTCNAQVNFKKGDKRAEELARKIVETIRGN